MNMGGFVKSLSIFNAIKCLCPYCGVGKLYKKYFTLNTKCSRCYRSFEAISKIGIRTIEDVKYDNSLIGFIFNKLEIEKPDKSILFMSGFISSMIAICFFILPMCYFVLNTYSNIQKWQTYVFTFSLFLCGTLSHIVLFPIIRSFKIHNTEAKKR